MSRIGVIVRQDLTGLGVQTRAIAKLLNAHKLVAIDFSPLNGNEQHPELLNSLTGDVMNIRGWIQPPDFGRVIDDIDVLITCEIDYSIGYKLTEYAELHGVKVIVIANFEFADWLQRPNLPMPSVVALHSEWRIDDFKEIMGFRPAVIRTPIDIPSYSKIAKHNSNRSGRFLHIAGRKTHEDRNGTQDLIEAVSLIPENIDFELVIKTQTAEVVKPGEFGTLDSRITVDSSQPVDERDLYVGFDAMILPRRYAGASLPMSEALAAGLPVIMTDIDPNNKILPHHWLVGAEKVGSFDARVPIDIYSANKVELAGKISQFALLSNTTLSGYKHMARNIAKDEFSYKSVMKNIQSVLL